MLKEYFPYEYAESVFAIDYEKLLQKGFKGIIFDIDNTLATYAMPVADENTHLWLKNLQEQGFGVYIVSNNDRDRVRIFSEAAQVGYYGKALKPLSIFLRKACRKMGVKPRETALVGDQLFTDIWGGNLLGMKTVLVKPISEVEDGFVKFKRRFERRILAKMKK